MQMNENEWLGWMYAYESKVMSHVSLNEKVGKILGYDINKSSTNLIKNQLGNSHQTTSLMAY